MARLIWLIALLFNLALPMPGWSGTTEGNPRDLTIRMEQNMLTVKAKDVPHRRLLEELAKRLKFELIIAGPLEDQRSLEIDARPWEEALKKALSPASWAFVYDSSGGEPRLAKVFVFPSKDNASGSGRPSSSPSRVAAPVPTPLPAPKPQGRQAARLPEQGSDASLTEMLEAEDEETRALALVGLAAMGGEQAVAALRQALQDKEAWIRETAVEALAEIGGEQAIQGLQQALRDENEDVRKAAQEALIRLQPNPQ
ncbi:MAG: HEAT repeat domain-containing protein [Candidatus Entotheonellia bacterium]